MSNEYFNTLFKHYVENKNLRLLVFVLIWHFNGISSHFNIIALAHFNSTEKMQRLYYVVCKAYPHISEQILYCRDFL